MAKISFFEKTRDFKRFLSKVIEPQKLVKIFQNDYLGDKEVRTGISETAPSINSRICL